MELGINEDFNKYYFTIIDFKKATELFADPDFDGEPVQIYTPKNPDDSPVPPDDETDENSENQNSTDEQKIHQIMILHLMVSITSRKKAQRYESMLFQMLK